MRRAPDEGDNQEFLSFVGHELKTPLTIIKGYAAALRRRLEGEEGQMAVDIEQEADRVTRMVNQLLDVSRIESGRLEMQPASLEIVELLEDVVSRHRSADGSRTIRVRTGDEDLRCLADESTLRRVLDDLLRNARQYSDPARPIEVAAAATEDGVEIAVRDEGNGISEGDLAHLSDKQFRASGANGEGLGLGLYIANGLLAAQGGRLEVESVPGQGSTFRVVLPAAGQPA